MALTIKGKESKNFLPQKCIERLDIMYYKCLREYRMCYTQSIQGNYINNISNVDLVNNLIKIKYY